MSGEWPDEVREAIFSWNRHSRKARLFLAVGIKHMASK
jgi:hypothetical protein